MVAAASAAIVSRGGYRERSPREGQRSFVRLIDRSIDQGGARQPSSNTRNGRCITHENENHQQTPATRKPYRRNRHGTRWTLVAVAANTTDTASVRVGPWIVCCSMASFFSPLVSLPPPRHRNGRSSNRPRATRRSVHPSIPGVAESAAHRTTGRCPDPTVAGSVSRPPNHTGGVNRVPTIGTAPVSIVCHTLKLAMSRDVRSVRTVSNTRHYTIPRLHYCTVNIKMGLKVHTIEVIYYIHRCFPFFANFYMFCQMKYTILVKIRRPCSRLPSLPDDEHRTCQESS